MEQIPVQYVNELQGCKGYRRFRGLYGGSREV